MTDWQISVTQSESMFAMGYKFISLQLLVYFDEIV